MENSKDQTPSPAVSSGSKLRYPLRSTLKSKSGISDVSESSASRRVRASPSVAQSTSALDLSAHNKPTKPPRRLSIPTKPNVTPRQLSVGNVTPMSETRLNKSNVSAKSDTPVSDVSKCSSRRKFSVLSSISYWLTQIKLAESASKHSVSLGFFKLALESGCEPLERMREELKSYVCKYNLLNELEDVTKDICLSFNIELEDLKLSEGKFQLNEAEKHDSNHGRNLKPKSLNSSVLSATDSNKREITEKKLPVSKKSDSSLKKKNANVGDTQNKSQKPRVGSNKRNTKGKTLSKDSACNEATLVSTEEVSHEDKENVVHDKDNMEFQSMEEAMLKREVQTN